MPTVRGAIRRAHGRSMILAMLATLATSCIALQRDPPQTVRYVLELGARPTPAANSIGLDGPRLAIRPLHAAALYAGRGLVYRLDAQRIETDFYHEYSVPPAVAIAEATALRLMESPSFAYVGLAGGFVAPDLVLEGDLLELFCDEAGQSPAAVLRVRFVLHDVRVRSVVWHGTLARRIELPSNEPDAVVVGSSTALREILDELATQLEQTLTVRRSESAARD